ncbi:MAG: alpha/beta hydrolase [Chloroflexi bacterium]|nr:alpha/beta hydrolase [Chloroflexota bacterium]
MQKTVIHFAHANGFPSGTYNKLFELLGPEYSVISIDRLGHSAGYPVDDNWASLTVELIRHIEDNCDVPVIGLGHSLGAILNFRAAHERPDLFRQIVMLDPPLVYGPFALFLAAVKKLRLAGRMGPAALTKGRREEWHSREEAKTHLRGKALFSRFDPDCFSDYIANGLVETSSGVRLSFDPKVEVEIFKTTPHDMRRFNPGLSVPGSLVAGEHSEFRRFVEPFARRHWLHFECFAGGSHLFPLEYPEATAILIKRLIGAGKQTAVRKETS